jgi:aquaporin TIP
VKGLWQCGQLTTCVAPREASAAIVPTVANAVRRRPYARPVEYDPIRRGIAELIGAFTLIFAGMGSIAFAGGSGLVAVALAHGLAIAIMVSAMGHISGAHFNPAITLAFLLTRRIVPSLAAVYVIAQLLGATLAALALRALFPEEANLDAGVPVLHDTINGWQGIGIEAVLTFFLVWAVFATAVDPGGTFKSIAGLAIGLAITIDILAAGPLTGAAMNPARAFGPELVQNVWSDWWVYWIGPAIGAVVAGIGYEYLYLRGERLPLVGATASGVDEPRPGETAAS